MSITSGVEIETVEHLYGEYDRFAAVDLSAHGITNPLEGRVAIVPRKASHYTMVLNDDPDRVEFARRLIKGVAKRRKVREVVCEKTDVAFNHFAPAGKVVVLYA
jgi:hypothetical protein